MTAHTAAARGLFTQPTTLTHTLPPADANAKVSVTLTRSTNNKTINKMGLDMFLSRVTRETKVYWRKANAIHAYIVGNYAEHDDCVPIELDRDAIEELRNRCASVLSDRTLAQELLPTQSGFFFGGTEYDEYYFEMIGETYSELTELLRDEKWDFLEYQASW